MSSEDRSMKPKLIDKKAIHVFSTEKAEAEKKEQSVHVF